MGNDPRGVQNGARMFLMPAGECEFTLNAIIEELRKDPWPVPAGTRPLQCTGNALFLAVTSLEIAFPKHGARVMLFSGGAASFGPGMIVGEVLVDSIRTQNDIKNEKATYIKAATAVYESLALRACNNGHSVDVFCCAIDQIGILEMRSLSEKTGGYLVLTDTYKSDVFTYSLRKIFSRDDTAPCRWALMHNPAVPLERHQDKWRHRSRLLVEKQVPKREQRGDRNGLDQHLVHREYRLADRDSLLFGHHQSRHRDKTAFHLCAVPDQVPASSGRMRMRVTTAKYAYGNLARLILGFDQETAAVIMVRWAVNKSETEETIDVVCCWTAHSSDWLRSSASTSRTCPTHLD